MTLASTTTHRSPGSRTTRSGRSTPSSPRTDTCSSKSQRSSMPACSTTRRSCSSPHWPRACGRRSAVTSAAVSRPSRSEPSRTCPTWACSSPSWRARSPSSPRRERSTCSSCVRSGATRASTPCRRSARSASPARDWARAISAVDSAARREVVRAAATSRPSAMPTASASSRESRSMPGPSHGPPTVPARRTQPRGTSGRSGSPRSARRTRSPHVCAGTPPPYTRRCVVPSTSTLRSGCR